MKMFENFEADLFRASNVKDLGKIMLANGIQSISADDKGVKVTVNQLGFLDANVKENCVAKENKYGVVFSAQDGIVTVTYSSNASVEELENKFGIKVERYEVNGNA